MSTFSETAREIVVDFWTYADKVSEAIAQWKKATGQYTAEYIHTQVLQLEQQSLDAKYRAERKLAALREKYETTAAAYYAPNGAVLDTADAKLQKTAQKLAFLGCFYWWRRWESNPWSCFLRRIVKY